VAWIVIEQKLESLRRALHRVQEKCPPEADLLLEDFDAQDILALNLTRAVQICVDIGASLISATEQPPPETMGQVFTLMHAEGIIPVELADRMKKAVGFRNLAVHNYEAINWVIVHAIATKHLDDFECFARAVVNYYQQTK